MIPGRIYGGFALDGFQTLTPEFLAILAGNLTFDGDEGVSDLIQRLLDDHPNFRPTGPFAISNINLDAMPLRWMVNRIIGSAVTVELLSSLIQISQRCEVSSKRFSMVSFGHQLMPAAADTRSAA